MMIVAAALFHTSGLTGVDSIEGAYEGLQQLVSDRAAMVFGIALLASGFASSSVGTMAGQVVMQGFIRRRIPLFLRRAITLAPALVVLAIGVNPTDALVASQVVLSFGIPFALVPLLIIAGKREVMGELVNPRWLTAFAGVLAGADHRPQRLPPLPGVLRLMERRAEIHGSARGWRRRAGRGLGAGDERRGDQRRARAAAADDGAAWARRASTCTGSSRDRWGAAGYCCSGWSRSTTTRSGWSGSSRGAASSSARRC